MPFVFLVVDAHTKFEVSSFSRSNDIGSRILIICASSAILDSTLNEYSHSAAASTVPQSTTLWNLNAICTRVAELERYDRFSNCRTLGAPIGTMYLIVGALAARRLRQMRPQLLLSDFWIFALFLNHSARNTNGVEKWGKFSHFLTPCEKTGKGWWRCYTNYSCHT